jgi:hypothetical protein
MSAKSISILFTLFRITLFTVLHDPVKADLPLAEDRLAIFESEIIPDLRQMADDIEPCEIRNPSFLTSSFQKTKSHMDSDQENKVDEDNV